MPVQYHLLVRIYAGTTGAGIVFALRTRWKSRFEDVLRHLLRNVSVKSLWGIGCLAPVRREAVCFSIWGGQFLASSPSSICATHAPKNHNLTKHTTRLHAPQKSGSVTIRAGVSLIWQGNTVYRNKECIKFSRADGSKNNAERRLCARALR